MRKYISLFLIIEFACNALETKPNIFCMHKNPKKVLARNYLDLASTPYPSYVRYQSICLNPLPPYVGPINEKCITYSKPGFPASLVTVHNVYCPIIKEKK